MKIVAIPGSAAEQSYNRMLLEFIRDHYSDVFEVEVLDISNVPLFNQDNAEETHEGPIHTINRKILQADGVIISTPEHNHTMPAALNSLIDWLSFKIHPLRKKPVLVMGASYFDQGTSRSQLHLRQMLDAPGADALVMPGTEFLLGNAREAFDEEGNLKDKGTVNFLRNILEDFKEYIGVVSALGVAPEIEEEDLFATKPIDTTIEGVDMTDPEWVEKAAEKVNAVSGDTYVKLDRGVLTVDQLNWFLKTIPAELTFADNNNQYLYYNHNQPGEGMLAKRFVPDVGSPLGPIHPPHTRKNVQWVIQQLRSGNMKSVNVHVPVHKDKYVVHNYFAMHDEDGKYRGINEIVLDLQPVIDWYLEQTGQELVGGTDASSGASMGGAWGTGGSDEANTDADSAASGTESKAALEEAGHDTDSGASYSSNEPDTASGASV